MKSCETNCCMHRLSPNPITLDNNKNLPRSLQILRKFKSSTPRQVKRAGDSCTGLSLYQKKFEKHRILISFTSQREVELNHDVLCCCETDLGYRDDQFLSEQARSVSHVLLCWRDMKCTLASPRRASQGPSRRRTKRVRRNPPPPWWKKNTKQNVQRLVPSVSQIASLHINDVHGLIACAILSSQEDRIRWAMIEEEAARVGRRVRVQGSREGETGREGGKGVLLAKSCFRDLAYGIPQTSAKGYSTDTL